METTIQSPTPLLTNETISNWFNDFISAIKIDGEMMVADVVTDNTKQFYTNAITGNLTAMNGYARVSSAAYFIEQIVKDYFKELRAYKIDLKKLAFQFSEAKILVWAEINQDDDAAERALILSEAKANAKYSENGFYVSSTIVETTDGFTVPPHYQEVKLDGRLSGAHKPS